MEPINHLVPVPEPGATGMALLFLAGNRALCGAPVSGQPHEGRPVCAECVDLGVANLQAQRDETTARFWEFNTYMSQHSLALQEQVAGLQEQVRVLGHALDRNLDKPEDRMVAMAADVLHGAAMTLDCTESAEALEHLADQWREQAAEGSAT